MSHVATETLGFFFSSLRNVFQMSQSENGVFLFFGIDMDFHKACTSAHRSQDHRTSLLSSSLPFSCLFIFIFCASIFACLHVCLQITSMPFWWRPDDPVELELQTVLSCHLRLGTKHRSSVRAISALSCEANSPSPESLIFKAPHPSAGVASSSGINNSQ